MRRKLIPGICLLAGLTGALLYAGRAYPFQAHRACAWGEVEYVAAPAQRVSLVDIGSDQLLLTSRRHPDGDGGTRRSLSLRALDRGVLDIPPIFDDYEWVHGARSADGTLRLFWTSGRQRRAGSDSTTSPQCCNAGGIHMSELHDGQWSPAAAVFTSTRVLAENSSGVLVGEDGRMHLAVTVYGRESTLPQLFHVQRRDDDWTGRRVVTPGAFYPQLVRVDEGEMVLLSIGAIPDENDGNSVWATRFDASSGDWQESVLVSRSGVRAAFAPAVLASGTRIDAVWARDLDGVRNTREGLWHAYSVDAGRSWSRPVQVAAATHIWRPALVPLEDGTLAAVYLVSEAYGSPGLLHMRTLVRGRWRRSSPVMTDVRVSDFAVTTPRTGEVVLAFATFHAGTGIDSAGVYRLEGRCGRKGGNGG